MAKLSARGVGNASLSFAATKAGTSKIVKTLQERKDDKLVKKYRETHPDSKESYYEILMKVKG